MSKRISSYEEGWRNGVEWVEKKLQNRSSRNSRWKWYGMGVPDVR